MDDKPYIFIDMQLDDARAVENKVNELAQAALNYVVQSTQVYVVSDTAWVLVVLKKQ